MSSSTYSQKDSLTIESGEHLVTAAASSAQGACDQNKPQYSNLSDNSTIGCRIAQWQAFHNHA